MAVQVDFGRERWHTRGVRSLALTISSLVLMACSPAQQLLTLGADRASATANGVDPITITATVTSATGSPSQDFVEFTASTGGVLSDARVKGNAAGVSTTRLTSMAGGTVTVTATVPRTAQQAEVSSSTAVSFTVPAGPRLRFQTSPMNTIAMNLLRPAPVVVVEDSSGALNMASTAMVTVAITAGSCAAALDASSLMTATADRGTATFYGLKSSTVARGCTLTATSGTIQAAVSSAFDIQ